MPGTVLRTVNMIKDTVPNFWGKKGRGFQGNDFTFEGNTHI
jgi:hypothetical protein